MELTRRKLGTAAASLLAGPRIAHSAQVIQIGVGLPITGAAAEAAKRATNGLNLALEEINREGVLGRQVPAVVEDDQTTNPGAVLAFSRLSARADIAAFIGPVRSSQVSGIAADVLKAGKPMMVGGTDPTLTHMGNRWLFRCRPSDSYSAKVIAEYGTKDLSRRQWAIVHAGDTFGLNGAKALETELSMRGIAPLLVQALAVNAADASAVALALRDSGVDVLATYFSLEADLVTFSRQFGPLDLKIPWIGSAVIANVTARKLPGLALYGTYGVADFAADASPTSQAFVERYEAAYQSAPDMNPAWVYDAVHLLARAMRDAGGTEPERLRSALLAIKGYTGVEGEYNFDENGDGLHGYNVVRNDGGKLVFVRRVDFAAG